MDRLGKNKPVPDDRLSATVTYVLSPGQITRMDVYTPKGSVALEGVRMEFATYSEMPSERDGVASFAQGAVRSFSAKGFEDCHLESVKGNHDYETPNGPFANSRPLHLAVRPRSPCR